MLVWSLWKVGLHHKKGDKVNLRTSEIIESIERDKLKLDSEQKEEIRNFIQQRSDEDEYLLDLADEMKIDVDDIDSAPDSQDGGIEAINSISELISDVSSDTVDRMSGSGNAIIDKSDQQWNLGPLPPTVVGEEVAFVHAGGTWALCLNSDYTTEEYKRNMLSKLNRNDISETSVDILGAAFTGDSLNLESAPEEGEKLMLNIEASNNKIGVGTTQDTAVILSSPALNSGQEYPIKIASLREWYAEAELDYSKDISVGEEISDLTVSSRVGESVVGEYKGYPVLIPNTELEEGDVVRVGVDELTPGYIKASVASIDPADRPKKGDILRISVEERNKGDTSGAFAWKDDIPIMVPGEKLEVGDVCDVAVSEAYDGRVVARVDELPDSCLPNKKEEISVVDADLEKLQLKGECVCWVGPQLIDSVEVNERPISEDDWSRMSVEKLTDAIVTRYGKKPVSGSNEHGVILKLTNVPIGSERPDSQNTYNPKTGVSSIESDHVATSISHLPDDVLPDIGERILIDVKSSTDQLCIGISDGIPVSVPITGIDEDSKLIVEIDEILDDRVKGISISIGDDGTKQKHVSKYLRSMQLAMENIREGRYSAAIDMYRSAVKETESIQNMDTDLLKWDAYRNKTFVEIEENIQREKFENAKSIIESRIQNLLNKDWKDDLLDILSLELESYLTIIEIMKRMKKSTGEQNVIILGFKSQIKDLPIRQLKEITNEQSSDIRSPHPLLNRHMEKLDNHADSIEPITSHISEANTVSVNKLSYEPPDILTESITGNAVERFANSDLITSTETESNAATESGVSTENTDHIEVATTQNTDKSQTIDSESDELSELRERAKEQAKENPSAKSVSGNESRYIRSPAVKEYAKVRADGSCEYCGKPAPFNSQTGDPYLEVHHVDELGDGGDDSPDKVIALCPTCHREVHYGKKGEELNTKIKRKLSEILSE
jgi:hypothetical protein